ncbi:hypothetical protein KOR34_16350 [Posidoniimonas corsicana]|uniref:Uncharacterized protein n=1 Tax=Posidoniimonas corsicana TaxID=1938618 RepID=A0A5C5VG71_9BACT|nr:hypothetical protein [Posidoniimonas corsicana]TWT36695.1 hypothetical protein KOR34_16350 [Posidoniimonas corsicana]
MRPTSLPLILLFALSAAGTGAEQPAEAPYRRVFAPANQPEAWPKTGEPWVPVAQLEALRLLRLGEPDAMASHQFSAYSVRAHLGLTGSVLSGAGEARVDLNGAAEAFLAWPASATRVTSIAWSPSGEPALLGDWGPPPAAPHGVLVDRSGDLRFELEGRPASVSDTRSEYQIGLPPATTTTLALDLPVGTTPSMSRAIVREEEPGGDASTPAPPGAGQARWRIEVAPGASGRLVLSRPRPTTTRATIDVAQDLRHAIRESGVETQCRFRLSSARPLPGAVRVALPIGARLIRATQDGLPVEWTLSEEEGGTTARVTLTRAPQGDCLLELWLLSPEASGQITLPSPVLLNARWTEGAVSVAFEEPVSLMDIAQLSYATPAAAPSSAEESAELFFRLSRPEASVQLQVGRRVATPAVNVTRSVQLGIDRQRDLHLANSTVTIQFAGDRQHALRRLRVALGDSWAVRAVEAEPAEALERWDIYENRGPKNIDIRLVPGAFAEQPPALTLTLARRSYLRGDRTPLTEMLAIDPSGVRVVSDQIELSAAEPLQVQLRSAPQPTPPPEDQEDAPLLFKTQQIPLAQLLAGGELELVSEPARRLSRCDVRVSHSGDLWLYQADLTIPANGASSIALVRFEPPLPESAELLLGERAPMPPRDDSLPNQSGAIALKLDGQPTTTFRIAFASQDQAPLDIPLPSLTRERDQQGRLTLVGAGAGVAGLRSNGLTPLPQDADTAAHVDQKTFAYDPERVGAQDLSALLTRQSRRPVDPPLRLLRVETRALDSGRLVHLLSYRVRPAAQPCSLLLPKNANLLSARDTLGLPIEEDRNADRDRLLFPAADSTRTIDIAVEDANRKWAPGAPLPLDGVVEDATGFWNWRFLLPSSYELSGPSLDAGPEPTSNRNRLLGPVASVLPAGIFDPFDPATWWPTAPAEEGNAFSAADCPPGWRCYDVACIGSSAPALKVIHHDQLVGGAATLGVLIACLSAWWWPYATRTLVTAALAAMVLALLLPGALAVWGAAVWLGLVAGAMLCPLVKASTGLLRAMRDAASFSLPATPTSAALALLAFAPTVAAQPVAEPPLETVIVPVDADGNPEGDKWYLRGGFLNQLNKLADGGRTAAPAAWVLKRISIQGALKGLTAGEGVNADPWTLSLEVWTSRRDTPLPLAIRQAEAKWGEKANIDGIATPLEWRDNGDGCAVTIAEPGPHRVTLSLTPSVSEEDAGAVLRLALPRCSLSELRLSVPDASVDVRAPELPTPLQSIEPGGALRADLSGTDELLLRWGTGSKNAAAKLLACDQLQWLSLRPGGAVLEVRCLLEGTAPLPKLLQATLPMADPDQTAQRRVELSPRTEWQPGLTQLVYTGTVELPRGGLGRFSVPSLPPPGVDLRSRMMAVSSSRELVVTTPATEGVAAFDPAEFAARWTLDETESPPDRAVAATDPLALWQVQSDMRPVEPGPLDQRLRLVLGQAASTARLTVGANPAGWPLGKLEVSVPTSFELIDCRLTAGGRSQPLRATRPQPSRVVVFRPADAMLGAGSVVELYGRVSVPSGRSTPLPVLRAATGTPDPLRVELWRLPDCVVRFAEENAPALDDSNASAAAQREMLVGTFQLPAQQPPPRVAIRAGATRYKVSHLTTHQRTESGVQHDVAARVRVLSGGLREIAIEFADRAPQLEVTSPSGATLTRASSEGPRRWRVSLPRDLAAGEELILKFEGQQVSPTGAHPAALVRFPDAAESEVVVAVHGGPHSEEERWLTESLTPARGAHDAPLEAAPGTGWSLFRSTPGQRPTVAWTRRDKRPPECLVRFSETTAAADPLGRVSVTTRVYLDPVGATACRLLVDENSRLVSLDLNGQGPIATRESDSVWRVTLGSSQRPQVLTATAVWDQPSTERTVRPPQLISGQGQPLTPVNGVVSLLGSTPAEMHLTADAQPIDGDDAARLRVQALAEQAPQAAVGRASAWWLSRLRDALAEVDAASPQSDDDATPLRSDESLAKARTAAAGEFTYIPNADAASDYDRPGLAEQLRTPTGEAPPAIKVSVTRADRIAPRVGLALLAVAAGVCFHVGCNQPALIGLLRDRRNTAIGLAGLAWWLWLPLGVCGLLLMVSAAVDEGRARYQRILSRR